MLEPILLTAFVILIAAMAIADLIKHHQPPAEASEPEKFCAKCGASEAFHIIEHDGWQEKAELRGMPWPSVIANHPHLTDAYKAELLRGDGWINDGFGACRVCGNPPDGRHDHA